MAWQLALEVEGDDQPRFLQIARAIVEEVRRGRLKPGATLPGSRTLAESLGVHRNTVLAAYDELAAEGWIVREPARGTFVSRELPDARPLKFAPNGRAATPERAGFDLPPLADTHAFAPTPKGRLPLLGGMPDLRLAPAVELARAYRRALRGVQARTLLDYGDPQGPQRLRAALADMLSALRGLAATPASVVVTRGSQMALYLTAHALLAPGDVVAVEGLGYRPAWEAFRRAGARLVPVPVDGEGLDVRALADLCARERVRAVYVTPHHQYPTTATLSAARRLELLGLARARRLAIVEDDYDHEFHYDGRPILPLASADTAGVVIYVGTLSKILAPGLRTGYLVAPAPVIERVVALRTVIDRQGDQPLEHALALLVEDGEVQRHARRARRAYKARRDLLAARLRAELPQLTFTTPPGGIALWVRADGVDVDAWAERALAAGVVFQTGRRFAFDGRSRPYVRLGFAACDEKDLREAVRRMTNALSACGREGRQ
jgi:GntR family transcriptional regulator/MocR family aminotransferase